MINVHSIVNREKTFNLDEFFQISNVNLESLVFVENDMIQVTGCLSLSIPHLKRVFFSLPRLTASTLNLFYDCISSHQNLTDIKYIITDENFLEFKRVNLFGLVSCLGLHGATPN